MDVVEVINARHRPRAGNTGATGVMCSQVLAVRDDRGDDLVGVAPRPRIAERAPPAPRRGCVVVFG